MKVMTFEINGIAWEVYTCDEDDDRIEIDGEKCFGVTDFENQAIYLRCPLRRTILERTVYHELTHAYIMSHGIHIDSDYDDHESVADFIGAFGKVISKLSGEIVERIYGERKCEA